MNATALIDAYVADVVKRLPHRQRADVALELRSLLTESLAAARSDAAARSHAADERAAAAGRNGPASADQRDAAADQREVAAFLADFGRPAEVAARYGPPVTVIDPADSRRFVRLSAIGLAVIWIGGAFSVSSPRQWWEEYAVAALVWPGLLVLIFAATAGVRRRWPSTGRWKPPRRDPDAVSRVGMSFALAFFVAGTATLVFGQWLLDRITSGAPGVLTYDPVFARRIAPWLLTLMITHLVFLGFLTVRGRWTPRLRQIDAGLGLAICAVMVWALVAGPVYTAPATDDAVKGIGALIVLGSLASVAVTAWRGRLSVPRQA